MKVEFKLDCELKGIKLGFFCEWHGLELFKKKTQPKQINHSFKILLKIIWVKIAAELFPLQFIHLSNILSNPLNNEQY